MNQQEIAHKHEKDRQSAYAEALNKNHAFEEAIRNILDGTWTADELRFFAIEKHIIPDPEKEIKAAHAEIESCEKDLAAAKKRWQVAMATRKCNSNE
jgi:hypothetical protein